MHLCLFLWLCVCERERESWVESFCVGNTYKQTQVTCLHVNIHTHDFQNDLFVYSNILMRIAIGVCILNVLVPPKSYKSTRWRKLLRMRTIDFLFLPLLFLCFFLSLVFFFLFLVFILVAFWSLNRANKMVLSQSRSWKSANMKERLQWSLEKWLKM